MRGTTRQPAFLEGWLQSPLIGGKRQVCVLRTQIFRYNLFDGAVCIQQELESRLSGTIAEIGFALEEKIF